MIGFNKPTTGNPGAGITWVVLTFVALLPTLCVLWFMSIAMRNEQFATRQKLTDIYQNYLSSAQRQVSNYWKLKQDVILSLSNVSSTSLFAAIVRSNLADSAILYNNSGKITYPDYQIATAGDQIEEFADWSAAQALEYEKTNFVEAALIYARIVEQVSHPRLKLKAAQAQANCLFKAGRNESALELLYKLTQNVQYKGVVSDMGVWILPNIQLRILQMDADSSRAKYRQTIDDLVRNINDYDNPLLSAHQRRFLMGEFQRLAPEVSIFPLITAEKLAASFLEKSGSSSPTSHQPFLQPTHLPGVWRFSILQRNLCLLFEEERIRTELGSLLNSFSLSDSQILILSPKDSDPASKLITLREAGAEMPNWRLALILHGSDPLAAVSARQRKLYFISGVLVVIIISLSALAAAHYIGAQMRLARLKNDLLSTVSHELKTPLASMRALVDTLLAGRYRNPQQMEDYLKLAAQENQRLSHLIDNFLTFSRLERKKQKFQFESVDIGTVINHAVKALQDRLHSDTCRFELDIAPNLPSYYGDSEALTTVLINLLDNALKYSGQQKHICLRAWQQKDAMLISVSDNGIGLTSLEAAKVFDRFYQADQSLSRRVGGCGLGLSIVKSLVDAHDGEMLVASEPGKGSTFTVKLPVRQASL